MPRKRNRTLIVESEDEYSALIKSPAFTGANPSLVANKKPGGNKKPVGSKLLAESNISDAGGAEWDFDFDEFHFEPHILDVVYETSLYISIDQLAVHPAKIASIKTWLLDCNQRILIVKGPSGSGKTLAIQLLCRRLNICIEDGALMCTESPHAVFGTKYGKLTLANDRLEEKTSIIIFDNLPDPQTHVYVERLVENAENIYPRMVFLITSPCLCEEDWSDSRLFMQLERLPFTTTISLNPVSKSLMSKVIPKLSPVQDACDNGDPRATLIDRFMRTVDPLLETMVDGEGRANGVSFFHRLGKILYPRKDDTSLEKIASLTEGDRSRCQLFLHANYPRFLADEDSMAAFHSVADSFSWLDSVLWNVVNDDRFITSLPEMTIAHVVLSHSVSGSKRTFCAIEAPYASLPSKRQHLYAKDKLLNDA